MTSLPPLVEGEAKGELVVSVARLQWLSPRGAPRAPRLRIKWWGEPGDGSVMPLGGDSGGAAGAAAAAAAAASFPVVCGPKLLTRYLRDAGSLPLAVEDAATGRVVASATLGLAAARAAHPLSATLPLLGGRGQVLGQLDARLEARYGPALSSFEMNEHRASVEPGLPLYPPAATAVAAATSAAAAAAAAAQPPVPALADSHTEEGEEEEEGDCAAEEGFLPDDAAAADAGTSGSGGYYGADDSADYDAAAMADAAAAAAAAAEAGAAAAPPPEPAGADAIAAIISKAERLKAAMDAAISRGLGPALDLPPGGGDAAAAAAPLGQLQQQQQQEPAEPLARLVQLVTDLSAARPAAPASGALPATGASSDGDDGDGFSDVDSGSSASGSSFSSCLSDFGELAGVEGLLLQELFFSRRARRQRRRQQQQQQAKAAGADAERKDTALEVDAARGGPERRTGAAAGPPLVVTILGIKGATFADGTTAAAVAVRARTGAASSSSSSNAATGAAPVETRLPWASDGSLVLGGATSGVLAAGRLVELEVEGPASLLPRADGHAPAGGATAAAAADRPALALEVWGCGAGQRQLLGIARVPLDSQQQQPPQQQEASQAGEGSDGNGAAAAAAAASTSGRSPLQLDSPALLASGTYGVWDVLRGRENGRLQLAVTLLPRAPAAPPEPPQPAPPSPQQPAQQQAAGGARGGGADARGQHGAGDGPAQPRPAAAAPPPAGSLPLVGVLHRFDVSVRALSGLPGAARLRAAGARAPEARFVGYRFPGDDEALYTGLAACGGAGDGESGDDGALMRFGASARHTIMLPPGEGVAEHLCGGGGSGSEPLVFEVRLPQRQRKGDRFRGRLTFCDAIMCTSQRLFITAAALTVPTRAHALTKPPTGL